MEKLPNLEKREKVIDELIEKLAEQEGMSFEDILGFMVGFAEIYMEDEDVKPYFEEVAEKANPKLAVPWITTELLGVLHYNKKTMAEIKIQPEHMIQLLNLIEEKKITDLKAKDILRSWKSGSKKIDIKDFETIDDLGEIADIVDQVIAENEKAVIDFKAGNQQTLNFLIGQIMNKSNKRADYPTARKFLEKALK